ncbi:hypothetical protein JTB14_024527 [Gonioctena quinquepunctata]|nr:hypothetical protein JTB14_024527 [Gonioctena quinquepunctata]
MNRNLDRSRRTVNAERLKHVQEANTYRGGTLMEWGGITFCGRTDQYLDDILQPIVRPFTGAVGENFHLLHDNAPPDVAHIVTDWLNNEEIE